MAENRVANTLLALQFCSYISVANGAFSRGNFIKDLFANYTNVFPPEPLYFEVSVGYKILSILAVNERSQNLESTARMKISWAESQLKWNRSDSSAPISIAVANNKIWKPNIVTSNAINNERQVNHESDFILRSDGQVFWSAYNHFQTACKIDIAAFPFDEQLCTIVISPTFKMFSPFILSVDIGYQSTIFFQESNEWELIKMDVYKEYYNETSYGSLEKGDIVVQLTLKRRYIFHIIKGVLPPVCLSMMNCFVFCLPAVSSERITMAISVLLSYTLYLSFINDSLPENSDTICIFSVYLSCLLILSTLIILATIYSISRHQQDNPPQLTIMTKKLDKSNSGDVQAMNVSISGLYDRIAFITFLSTTCLITAICFAMMIY